MYRQIRATSNLNFLSVCLYIWLYVAVWTQRGPGLLRLQCHQYRCRAPQTRETSRHVSSTIRQTRASLFVTSLSRRAIPKINRESFLHSYQISIGQPVPHPHPRLHPRPRPCAHQHSRWLPFHQDFRAKNCSRRCSGCQC